MVTVNVVGMLEVTVNVVIVLEVTVMRASELCTPPDSSTHHEYVLITVVCTPATVTAAAVAAVAEAHPVTCSVTVAVADTGVPPSVGEAVAVLLTCKAEETPQRCCSSVYNKANGSNHSLMLVSGKGIRYQVL